uniref:cytochrome c heme attachment protein n=1 Tax=Eriocaulon truncatum TaxID=2006105 RepID=UPI00218210DC|nr:cytochrome c heme attachment protein [Eriocaulon truncatum]UVH66495.1 cytochrome c heme attachment protein [Eriocaulon truncatum]UVH66750.1 cytochrome c heme attachment protein [Eriocaulon truncatum]
MISFTLEHILTHISFSTIAIVILIQLMILFEIEILHNSSERGMISLFLSIFGLLFFRWISLEHLPLSNLYESLMFLSFSLAIIYLIQKIQKQTSKTYLSKIIAPSIICIQSFSTSSLFKGMHQSTILVPALQSHWLMMHVSMMLLSYATLLCGSLLSVAFLVIQFRKKLQIDSEVFQKISVSSLFNYNKYQITERLDYWSYRFISLGFIFLTIGILCGAVWANEAWGSYWNWDPKETWAFITWATFAIYLHTRKNNNWKGINSAFVAFIGFLIIWICYFGINLLEIGLHSYGSFTLLQN